MDGEPFTYDDAIRLRTLNLALDPRRRERFAYVSHAHTDHVARHLGGFATPATVALVQARLGICRLEPLEFNTPLELEGYHIELRPAGHVLGASQIVVDAPGGTRFVYTGDFSVRPGRIVPPAAPTPCDVLVMECTYGKPRYRFPTDEEIAARVWQFVERAFADRSVPVLLAYALGKAQEAIRLVNGLGFRVAVHPVIGKLAEVYHGCGVDCGAFETCDPDGDLDGRVLVIPPGARQTTRSWIARRGRRMRTLFLSGWAIDPGTRYRMRVDDAVPLSDHADFAELIAFVEQARPRRVYTLHGPPEFADELCARGFAARHLG